MSLQPAIKIHTDDIQKIMDALEQKRMGPMEISIVDEGHKFVLRDSGGFVITYVTKTNHFQNHGE